MKCSVSPCFHCVGLMLRAFSPSGFGSRWLSWENSTSGNEFSPVCAIAAGTIEKETKSIDVKRIEFHAANPVRAWIRGAQAASLFFSDFPRQAADECRLAACAPQIGKLTRARRRPRRAQLVK